MIITYLNWLFLTTISLMSMVFMCQHLSHRNFHGLLVVIAVPGIYFLLNQEQLISVGQIPNKDMIRLLLILLASFSLFSFGKPFKTLLVFSPLLLVLGLAFANISFAQQIPYFDIFSQPRMFLLMVGVLCFFKFRKGRSYTLMRRFIVYTQIFNLSAILLKGSFLGILTPLVDLLTCVFLIYFVNLYLVKISFKLKMREVSW